ncbi:MAG: S-methyl-5-thioribose-1-phosphate isomerase [Pseudomonadota bacterium]
MNYQGQPQPTIGYDAERDQVWIIDQTRLPGEFVLCDLTDLEAAVRSIADMQVRGAPLIGATAAFGVALEMRRDPADAALAAAADLLVAARPTAVNLAWAVARMVEHLTPLAPAQRAAAALALGQEICREDEALCSAIGDYGLPLIQAIAERRPGPVNVLTHCNAGALATLDWGTATAPIYKAFDAGIDVHVWVDETRPRNQGAALTAWELGAHGVPHTVIVDNAGGHLMQRGLVDLCLVGTDRTVASGDVCNKIGTYLKALAADDNQIPFYVCAPSPSIDWDLSDGLSEIPIEQRDGSEIRWVPGVDRQGQAGEVDVVAAGSAVRNDAFDVTPARLVTGLITERGICSASRDGLAALFPDLARNAAAVSGATP